MSWRILLACTVATVPAAGACGDSDADGSTGGSGGAGTTTTDASTTSGNDEDVELTISNLVITAAPVDGTCFACGAVEPINCGDYDIRLTLTNSANRAIDSLEALRFTAGEFQIVTDGGVGDDSNGISCQQEPWALAPGAST